jgi:acylphosphatase
MTQCERYRISGHVQGVGFRAATAHVARDLGLCGWVRNLPGGDVEVLAQGDLGLLQQLFNWLQQGPPFAQVTHVERIAEVTQALPTGFQIR